MKKKIFLAVGVVLAAAVIFAAITFYPMLSMRPAETGLIPGTDITAVKSGQGTVYAISYETGYILIDAGSNSNDVVSSLRAEGIEPDKVIAVMLTHTDVDHVASLGQFPKATIFIGRDELQMINGETPRSGGRGNALPEGVNIEDVTLFGDNSDLQFGDHKIVGISTPGHTPGSTSYILDDKYLFTGDCLRPDGEKLLVHPFTMDEATALETIEDLSDIIEETEIILTSHYGYTVRGNTP